MTTNRRRRWWKQMRMKMVLAMAILAVLLVIIIPISVYAKRVVDANRKVRAGSCSFVKWLPDPLTAMTPEFLLRTTFTEQVDDDAVHPPR